LFCLLCINLIVVSCWFSLSSHSLQKFLFYNKFLICLYMFRALCGRHQEVRIVLYSIWHHHTCRWPSSPLSIYTPDGHLQIVTIKNIHGLLIWGRKGVKWARDLVSLPSLPHINNPCMLCITV